MKKLIATAALLACGSSFAALNPNFQIDPDGAGYGFDLGTLTVNAGDQINLSFDFLGASFAPFGLATAPESTTISFSTSLPPAVYGGSGPSTPAGAVFYHYSASFATTTTGTFNVIVSGINSGSGEITAIGNAAATITPVPEPETYAMMLAGLGALGFMARRRQAK